MALATEGLEIQRIQTRVSGSAAADLMGAFRSLSGLDPVVVRNALVEILPGLVSAYGMANAAAAGEWFEAVRVREVGSGFPARLAKPVGLKPIEKSIRFSAAHLFDGRADLMEDYLTGQLIKWVNAPARDTIIGSVDADPIGRGWQRVCRAGGCDFCRALSDRGGVYTRKNVYFAAHRNCNCGVVPSWDPSLPEVNVQAYTASKRMERVRRVAADDSDPVRQARAQQQLDAWRRQIHQWIGSE